MCKYDTAGQCTYFSLILYNAHKQVDTVKLECLKLTHRIYKMCLSDQRHSLHLHLNEELNCLKNSVSSPPVFVIIVMGTSTVSKDNDSFIEPVLIIWPIEYLY